jgi:GPH family glycoside/pentoside/hexuronide:cation symporter
MKEIIQDKFPRWVFMFMFVVILGITLVSSLQMYLYEHFMKFSGIQKSIAHGGTMIGTAIGAAMATGLTKIFDKKKATVLAVIGSIICNLILAILLLPGWLKPDQLILLGGLKIPFVFILFVLFHSSYWVSNGIILPISASMMADVSEINEIQTGVNKDGSYSAVYSFISGLGGSVGALFSGYALTMIGFAGTGEIAPSDVAWRLCAVTLLVGPFISMLASILIMKYPVTISLLNEFRSRKQTEIIKK